MEKKSKYAWTVKVGKRGQFVIPMETRKLFGIQPGDTLIVLADAGTPSGDTIMARKTGQERGKGIAIPCRNLLVKLAAEEEGNA